MSERDSEQHSQGRGRSRSPQGALRDEWGAGGTSMTIEKTSAGFGWLHRFGEGSMTAEQVARAQRTVGNAAVQRLIGEWSVRAEPTSGVQQRDGRAVVWRAPDPPKADAAKGTFRFERTGFVFFDAQSDGIRFLVGVPSDQEKAARGALAAIGQRIAKDNGVIKNPAFQVTTCIITNTGSRLALWKNRPTLLINQIEADTETVAHEMGHAVFYYLEQRAQTTEADAKPAGHFRVAVADIFNRLANTKQVKKTIHTREDGKIKKEEREEAAGLWIVDPSQWKGGKQPLREHPWDDPDEFFGSAKEAYQINRTGLEQAIARFKKIDPAVEAPMRDLLALMDALFTKAELPKSSLTAGDAGWEAAAVKALAGVRQPSTVENASDAGVQILISAT